jgi:hypothetical protein
LTAKPEQKESCVILDESSSVVLSEDLDSYEELSSGGSSEEEDGLEKETFI